VISRRRRSREGQARCCGQGPRWSCSNFPAASPDRSRGRAPPIWPGDGFVGIVTGSGQSSEFEKSSPHRFAKNFKTPNLIIHNELDFRVPIGQGLSLFTTLQRKGVPSKLLYFPDEGHWVLKPQNSELWHTTVFEWLAGYLKK
jgi:pimeloyl-ACP methyl ester carboxylesterase